MSHELSCAKMIYSCLVSVVLSVCLTSGSAFILERRGTHTHSQAPTTTTRLHLSLLDDPTSAAAAVADFSSSLTNMDAPTMAGLGLVALAAAAVATSRPPAQLLDPTMLQQIAQGTYLASSNNKKLQCVYKASRDGWSAQAFHAKVDNLGSAIVAAQVFGTSSIIGGYNPNGWRSTDDYYLSNQAFLWMTMRRGNKRRIRKLPIVPGSNSPALFDYATAGPCFGTSDLQIGPLKAAVMGGFTGPDMEDMSVNAADLKQGKSSVVNFEWTDQWPVRGSFRLREVEVYCRQQ